MDRLPAFIALRALEAAARLKSYSRAADSLGVTHGAVSQQIRRLEAELGLALFIRVGNAMEPTPEARRLAARVAEALALLRTGVAELRAQAESSPLVVSAETQFASRWLRPRLARLGQDTGEAHLELRVEDRMADLVGDGVDVAVRYGSGPWPGVSSALLIQDRLSPVCSPEFLARHRLARPEDVLHAPRLRHPYWPWSLWFAAAGLTPPADGPGLSFDDSSLLIDAAAQGLGLALGRSSLMEPELASGRLVRPFPDFVAGAGFHVVWRDDAPKRPRILKLRDWMLAEAAAQR